jgi:hypothetical protein
MSEPLELPHLGLSSQAPDFGTFKLQAAAEPKRLSNYLEPYILHTGVGLSSPQLMKTYVPRATNYSWVQFTGLLLHSRPLQ